MKKKLLKIVIINFALLLFHYIAFADNTDPNKIPIDGGFSALLIAGLAYGGFKLFKGQKQIDKE